MVDGNQPSLEGPTPGAERLIFHEIANVKEVLLARLDALERAHATFKDDIERVPTEVQRSIIVLRELLDGRSATSDEKLRVLAEVNAERFAGLGVQLRERDSRSDQVQHFIDARFTDAKEAITKAEVATTKQFDQIDNLLRTMTKGMEGQIDDLKTRVTGIESRTQGITMATLESRQVRDSGIGQGGFIAAIIFGIMSLVIGIAGVAIAFSHSNAPTREERIFEVPTPNRQQQQP